MEIFIYSLIPKCITALEDDLDILGKRFKFECQFEKIKIDQSRLAMMYDKKMYSFFFFLNLFLLAHHTILVGVVGQVGERRTANRVTSLASRFYRRRDKGYGGTMLRPLRKKRRTGKDEEGNGWGRFGSTPRVAAAFAVQVVSCSLSTFFDDDRLQPNAYSFLWFL